MSDNREFSGGCGIVIPVRRLAQPGPNVFFSRFPSYQEMRNEMLMREMRRRNRSLRLDAEETNDVVGDTLRDGVSFSVLRTRSVASTQYTVVLV